MKTLVFYLVLGLTPVIGQTPAPSILPTSAFINYGSNVLLTASGCSGTVRWSTGQTGTSITVMPKQSTRFFATCSNGGQTSLPSNSVLIQVGLTTSPCASSLNVTSAIQNIGAKYESNTSITGSSTIDATSSIQFKGQNFIQLNPGFEVKSGGVFKAFIGKCTELQTRQVATRLELPWEILWGPDN